MIFKYVLSNMTKQEYLENSNFYNSLLRITEKRQTTNPVIGAKEHTIYAWVCVSYIFIPAEQRTAKI